MAPHTDPTRRPSHQDVLGDPDAHTVEEVLAAFATSTPGDIAASKELEAAGQDRKGIADWAAPTPERAPNEPTFTLARILGGDGQKITGQPRHVIVGALYGDQRTEFTRDEVNLLVQRFFDRRVQPAQEA